MMEIYAPFNLEKVNLFLHIPITQVTIELET